MSNEELEQAFFAEAALAVIEDAVNARLAEEPVALFPVPQEEDEERDTYGDHELSEESAGPRAKDENEQDMVGLDVDVDDSWLDGRMEISTEERRWAFAIKTVIEREPEVDNLSDFLYVQLALIDKDNVEAAVERAYKMQAFREEYKIVENLNQGRQCYQGGINQFPGFFLSINFLRGEEGTGNWTIVVDQTKMTAETLKPGGALDTWMKAAFYQFHAVSPDFEAIREGVVVLIECDGFDPKKQFGMKVFSRMWNELGLVYPVDMLSMKHFHTGVFLNLLVSLAKRVLPLEVHRRFEVGHICQAGLLRDVFTTPCADAANRRLMDQFTQALKLRYENEASFSL